MQGTRVGPGGTPTRSYPHLDPSTRLADLKLWRPTRGYRCVHAIRLVRGSARAAYAPSWQAAPTVSRAERAEPGAVRPLEAGTSASGRGLYPHNPGLP